MDIILLPYCGAAGESANNILRAPVSRLNPSIQMSQERCVGLEQPEEMARVEGT